MIHEPLWPYKQRAYVHVHARAPRAVLPVHVRRLKGINNDWKEGERSKQMQRDILQLHGSRKVVSGGANGRRLCGAASLFSSGY